MSDPEISSNKRIAKNATFLYVRTIITTLVGIYTSRVILQTLGVEDYGIYNVAGSIVGLLGFINASMAGATSRFITYELGRGDQIKLQDTFSSAWIIHLGIAVIVVILAEAIGLWFLYNKLVIPEGRMWAAEWVFHLSVLSTFFSITQVPFDACLVAHERFDVTAYLSMFSTFAKLGVLYIVNIMSFDNLVLYSFLILVVSIMTLMFARIFCRKHFAEAHYSAISDRSVLKPMLSFSGWEMVGNIGRIGIGTGTNMIINMFLGVVVNASMALGNTVSGAVNGLAFNLVSAFQPSITKNYARGDIEAFQKSIIFATSMSIFVFGLFAVPMILQCHNLLSLWLETVPPYTREICIIHLSLNGFMILNVILAHSLKAMGHNSGQNIYVGISGLITILLIYWGLSNGYDVLYAVLICDAGVLITIAYNSFLLSKHLSYSRVWSIYKNGVFKVIIILLVVFLVTKTLMPSYDNSFLTIIVTCCISSFFSILGIFVFVLNNEQRKVIFFIMKKFINK